MNSIGRMPIIKDQRGAVAIIIGFCMLMFLGFAALALDLGHLFVAKNELQNAADAGALAGAHNLYIYDEDRAVSVNPGANNAAVEAATANLSEKVAVEVNDGDVERGHYCFATETFTPSDSLDPVDLWDVTWDELDANLNFINAVRVKARRDETPVAAFFSGIFGDQYNSFKKSAEAIAYIGFAGHLRPEDVDQPIVICSEAIRIGGEYSCGIGRMINSGNNVASNETGGWTDYTQDNPCQGGTNAGDVRDLICTGGNPEPIALGRLIATNGGEIQTAFKSLYDCWVANSANKTQPWELTLPVVECPGNNITTCQRVVGAVTVTIIWINEQNDPDYTNAPKQMGDWAYDPETATTGQARWTDFVKHYNLKNQDGTDAPYNQKSIYFLPNCEPHEPIGTTGGENFGILARIPVLVNIPK